MHNKNIIHNDLHNSNIYIAGNGEPYILDFGLAQKVEGPKKYMEFLKIKDINRFFGPNMKTLAENDLILKDSNHKDMVSLRVGLKNQFKKDSGICNKAGWECERGTQGRKLWYNCNVKGNNKWLKNKQSKKPIPKGKSKENKKYLNEKKKLISGDNSVSPNVANK